MKLNQEQLDLLRDTKKLQVTIPVQGYDVFELVDDGFYKGLYRVHGKSLYDVPELDDNDNVISVTPKGTFTRSCVLPKFISKYCPLTNGQQIVNIYNESGLFMYSAWVKVEVLKENNDYYWNIDLNVQ